MGLTILRVSQLNRYVRSQLEADTRLSEVYLRGEIANLAVYPSGHVYFSLRDDAASVRAVMFSSSAGYLRFSPENGMQVLVRGSVTLFERDGAFQIKVTDMMPDGGGERALKLEMLKKKLGDEGLFSYERKRPLPKKVSNIGVVTSKSGAVIHDIASVLERKAPQVNILLSPTAVQGAAASESIVRAIELLNLDARSDVIIVARGGGSSEDLEAFQEENVVRAVAGSLIPVITAIGHETDTSLCDFASDMRAATPTAAAEIAVGGMPDISLLLEDMQRKLNEAMSRKQESIQNALETRKDRMEAFNSESFLALHEERLYNILGRMHIASENVISQRDTRLSQSAAALEMMSPLRVLARGYSVTRQKEKPILSADEIKPGDEIETLLFDGKIISVVTEVNGNDL